METPRTLQQALVHFSKPENCNAFMIAARFTDGGAAKVAVMGLLENHGEVKTMVVSNVKRKSLRKEIDTHVEPGAMVYTDAFKSYNDGGKPRQKRGKRTRG